MTHQDLQLRELADDFEEDWLKLESDDVDPAQPGKADRPVRLTTAEVRAKIFAKGPANKHYASNARTDHGGDHSRWR